MSETPKTTSAKDFAIAVARPVKRWADGLLPRYLSSNFSYLYLATVCVLLVIGFVLMTFGRFFFYIDDYGMLNFHSNSLIFNAALIFLLTPIGVVIHLTLARKWPAFWDFLALRKAKLKDRRQSYTTDPRLAREMPELSTDKGTFLSIAPETQFPRRKESILRWDDDRHVFMCAGSRAGKGVSFILNELINHQGSMIVFDPAGENFAATAAYRQQVLGQKVYLLDPFGVTGQPSDCWNPMGETDFDTDRDAMDQAKLIAESLKQDDQNNPYFRDAARKMLSMVTAYVGVASIKENAHLSMVRDLLMTGEPNALWLAMEKIPSFNGAIKSYARSNATRDSREFGNVLETARTTMTWLDSPLMAANTVSSTFTMKDLKREKATLYVVLPAGKMRTYATWLRLIFNAAFDAMQDLSIPKPETPAMFLMDEFPLLGPMERFEAAAGEAAKFGVKLFICCQSLSQIKRHYGIGWESFIANAGLSIFFGNNDLETQQYVSARLGTEKRAQHSYGGSSTYAAQGASSSSSWNVAMQDAPVARTDELERLASRQAGRAFYFIAGRKPLLLPRAYFYEHDTVTEGLVYEPRNQDTAAVSVAAE